MISVFVGNDEFREIKEEKVRKYFEENNLENIDYLEKIILNKKTLKDILKLKYIFLLFILTYSNKIRKLEEILKN